MHPDAYPVPAGKEEYESRVLGSRFLAKLIPVKDEEEARLCREVLLQQYPDARHHCWALQLGKPGKETRRFSDEGEPAGSAGAPIARAIASSGLSDLLIVVIRWFGGKKLGVGGLIRAYTDASREVLSRIEPRLRYEMLELQGLIDFAEEAAMRRLLDKLEGRILSAEYGEKGLSWHLEMPKSKVPDFLERSRGLGRGKEAFQVRTRD